MVDIKNNNAHEVNKNTGSAEYQITVFTDRIRRLNAHLLKNKKDYKTQRSLVNIVNKRRKMLNYYKKISSNEEYVAFLERIKKGKNG